MISTAQNRFLCPYVALIKLMDLLLRFFGIGYAILYVLFNPLVSYLGAT